MVCTELADTVMGARYAVGNVTALGFSLSTPESEFFRTITAWVENMKTSFYEWVNTAPGSPCNFEL